ncbi:hypothetical protein EVAR_32889_1 [Eumeta japonica]|uniref:Uncharacterized protein n=1 Tax=Eumeta variegata TaxID=151549 RepID=A0A4C1VPM4_EUMVA|nr:hypothetical protein EVAR_32889_1 [Eumeta japonica]
MTHDPRRVNNMLPASWLGLRYAMEGEWSDGRHLAKAILSLDKCKVDFITIPTSKIQKASLPKRASPLAHDDRNPDLIPLSKVRIINSKIKAKSTKPRPNLLIVTCDFVSVGGE